MFIPKKQAGPVMAASVLAAQAMSLEPDKIRVQPNEFARFKSHGNERLTIPEFKPRGDRNAPCACGSTKKFKKCCGAAPKYDAPPVAEQPQAA